MLRIIIISTITTNFVTIMSSETITGSLFLDQLSVGLIVLAVGAVGAFIYKNRDKIKRKKKDFYLKVVDRKKPDSQKSFNDKFGNVKSDKPSVETNMRALRKLVRVFNPQPIIYNETLYCGCKVKDKVIVKLCKSDRQRYIVMTYVPPEGYCISDETILD